MTSVTVGVSLKAYFDRQRAREWFSAVADQVGAHPAVRSGSVEVFVAPSYLHIDDAVAAFSATRIQVGAQDVSAHGRGAFTGEVSAEDLAESHVAFAEIGHAERRRLFGETDGEIAGKTIRALRNGVVPVICIGETEQQYARAAAVETVAQLSAALEGAPRGRVIAAYEPVWAIGASEPASIEHIALVTRAVRAAVAAEPGREGSAVIYGGSAGPGLFAQLGDDVDGLFLGRFAHDPAAFAAVIDEAAAVAARLTRAAS